jgi:hypothetical protein
MGLGFVVTCPDHPEELFHLEPVNLGQVVARKYAAGQMRCPDCHREFLVAVTLTRAPKPDAERKLRWRARMSA